MPKARKAKSTSATSKSAKAAATVSNAQQAIGEVVSKGKDVVEDVVEAVKDFADNMTGIEGASALETPTATETSENPPNIGEPPESNRMTGVEKTVSVIQAEVVTPEEPKKTLTMEERKAKMALLHKKIAASTKANRSCLVEDAAKTKLTARDAARLEKQRKLAEVLRAKADAEEAGEDVARQKNWEWTIEENDYWEKKMARKKRRADFEFHDDAHAARRRYKKDLDLIKPDLAAYNKQKELAMGYAPGSLVGFDPSSGSSTPMQVATSQEQKLAAENLYRDANTLIYGDSNPSEDAIDRVVSKINKDIDKKGKFSRKRLNEDEGDITYINEHNRVFNKKIARYYDKYTTEIRASFERGTAL